MLCLHHIRKRFILLKKNKSQGFRELKKGSLVTWISGGEKFKETWAGVNSRRWKQHDQEYETRVRALVLGRSVPGPLCGQSPPVGDRGA